MNYAVPRRPQRGRRVCLRSLCDPPRTSRSNAATASRVLRAVAWEQATRDLVLGENGFPTRRAWVTRSRWRRIRDNVVHNLISYLVWLTYLGLGVAVADASRYLDIDHATAVTPVISAAAAVLFWPLVLIGTNLRA